MSENKFNISTDIEVITQKRNQAYPILIKEWCYINEKVKNIKSEHKLFHTLGSILLGASGSCLITIIATDFSSTSSEYLCWSIFGVTLICGFLSLYYANKQKEIENSKPEDISKHMELIESRFKEE